jgi:glycerophosphoryl diester phosphodiesterase
MILVGHRGASYHAPENTRSSILKAWDLGAKGVEFDIQWTLDGEIILLHDETLERTGHIWDKDLPQGLLKDPAQNLSLKDIQKVDVGYFFSPTFKNEKIITLNEALNILPKGKFYLVEIKGGDSGILTMLEKSFLKNNLLLKEQVKFIGFDLGLMIECKKLLSKSKCEVYGIFDGPPDENDLINLKKAKLDGVDLRADEGGCNETIMNLLKRIQPHWKTITWVPKHPIKSDSMENAKRLKSLNVDFFTSNMPFDVIHYFHSL